MSDNEDKEDQQAEEQIEQQSAQDTSPWDDKEAKAGDMEEKYIRSESE